MKIPVLVNGWEDLDTENGPWNYSTPTGDIAYAISESKGAIKLNQVEKILNGWAQYHYDGKWEPGKPVGSELVLYVTGKLKNGKYFALEAGNDYTGWGCMGDYVSVTIHYNLDDLINNGLTQEARTLLLNKE